jgi:hypothetical protein
MHTPASDPASKVEGCGGSIEKHKYDETPYPRKLKTLKQKRHSPFSGTAPLFAIK